MVVGEIIAGVLAPHPPHLVYAENPTCNEPIASGGWEQLRWAYKLCRKRILEQKPDVILIHTPHWQTVVGHHLIGLEQFKGLSVDPIFPHLFRYNFDLHIDCELSEMIYQEGKSNGLLMKKMTNPDFRIDYGSITSLHMMNPAFDIPCVILSANNSPYYFSVQKGLQEMSLLGQATLQAIRKSGKKALLLASTSLSHRHFVDEPDPIEDMSKEHVYSNEHYLWDMRVLNLMSQGKMNELYDVMPQFIDETMAEVQAGSLTWMLEAMGKPEFPAIVHGYGNVIGTGNAVVEWNNDPSMRKEL